MGKLTGKVAIVTGASRGIGQMISELFASEGAKVVCAARTMNEGEHRMLEGSLARTVENIKAKGGEATACTADVSTEPDCIALVEAARRAYGTVDILVNNAALNYYLPTETYPTNRWIRCFAVNVHGPFMLSKEVLKDMIPKRSGAIVNISSGAAIGPGRGPYDEQECAGRRDVRRHQSGAGAVHPGPGAGGRAVRWDQRDRGVAVSRRAHARHDPSQAGHRRGRPERRAADPDGPRRSAAGQRGPPRRSTAG